MSLPGIASIIDGSPLELQDKDSLYEAIFVEFFTLMR
jgi:hypothetical protein